MVRAVGFDEVKALRKRREVRDGDGGFFQTPYLESDQGSNQPQANLNHPDPGVIAGTHFHEVDQFQVVVGGTGKIGRHPLAPYSVHFARAYTPYGPLESLPGEGLQFLVLRCRYDPGSRRLPKAQELLDRVSNRQPWQVSRHAEFGDPGPDASKLVPIPGMQDHRGLSGYTLQMQPHAHAQTPDPRTSDGQYLVVVRGSAVLGDGAEKGAIALVYSSPEDGPLSLQAGAAGLDALILSFPRSDAALSRTPRTARTQGYKTWQCRLCAFVYDEEAGLPEEGLPAGTRWEDVPGDWTCPDCNVSKRDFHMIEI